MSDPLDLELEGNPSQHDPVEKANESQGELELVGA